MENNLPVESRITVDGLRNKVGATNKGLPVKNFTEAYGENQEVGSRQPQKSHNSRLDTMKRQFNKKLNHRGLPTPQRMTAGASSGKLNNRSHGQTASNEINNLGVVPPKMQTLNASNFAVKGHGSVSTLRNADKHEELHEQKDVKASSNFRPGRERSRAMQKHKSASARQVLENVLMKEMKASSAIPSSSSLTRSKAAVADSNSSHVTVSETNDKSSGHTKQNAAPEKHLPSGSNCPAVSGFASTPLASSSIREKLKQHHRQPAQALISRPDLIPDLEESGNVTDESNLRINESTLDDVPHIPATTSSNESILNRIRQKGPMIAKRPTQQAVDETDGPPSSQHGHNVTKPLSKVASRPGSPRTPRRKTSPASTGRTSPSPKRLPSPMRKGRGRNPSPNRRPPSPNTDGVSPYSPEATTKKVNRVLKARLYLLQQNGPNSFRIGGDSPEHKYLVIVGPQTCNCGRGQFCIHVLFVMLRVFQLEPTSGLLWRRTLKNYEVEMLFKSYHERCNSRIAPKKKSRVQRLVSHLANGSDKHPDGSSNSDDQSSSKGEEENCPICLLQMVDGESVTVCEVGCRNKLHTHCVNIWAEECKRNGGPLKCPLCRVIWKPAAGTGVGIETLMVEIPPEYAELADNWIQVFGWELVSFLFSTHANVRENALRRLSHDITGALLTNNQTSASEERHSDDSDSSREAEQSGGSSISSNVCLASCCAILAMVCADPEYRVYITALRTFRGMMAYAQCRTDDDVIALQRLLVPVIETILLKCADSNRRTVQLSVSTVLELCRGQSGELAVGREIANGGVETLGVGDIEYFLSFLRFGSGPDTMSWQWMLGRLNGLSELFREFRAKLSLSSTEHDVERSDPARYLLHIAQFASSCLRHTSQPRVIKIARRVFLHAYILVITSNELTLEMEEMLRDVSPQIAQKLKRKMNAFKSIASNGTENANKLIEERFNLIHSHSEDNLCDGDVLDIHSPQAPPSGLPHQITSSTDPSHPWHYRQHEPDQPGFDHEPLYPANRYRVPHAPLNTPSYAWTPRSRDNGVIEEPTHHHNHPPSPCTVTHPPTPPPSSVDTANLEAAIEVSLFRPIRSISPGRDSSKPETQVPTSSMNEDEMFLEEMEEHLPGSQPNGYDIDPPLRCFTVADAIAQGSLRPRPVTRPDDGSPLHQQQPHGGATERPSRPSLLRFKSESSAFQDMASPRASRAPATTTIEQRSFVGSRDRSSSHESNSSTSYSDDLHQASSDRRRSVRELADNFNRKHVHKHAKAGGSNPVRGEKATTPLKQSAEIEDETTPSEAKVDAKRVDAKSCDGVTANSKPISLKAAAAIERRGTVERYREGLKYGLHASALPGRKHYLQQKALAEEGHDPGGRKAEPHISPFLVQPQAHVSRTPARGILKNGNNLPVRASGKSNWGAQEIDGYEGTLDDELTHDSMSTIIGDSSSTKSLFTHHLTSPETEALPNSRECDVDARHGDFHHISKTDTGNTDGMTKRKSPHNKHSNKLKDSPGFSQSEDDDCPSASSFYRSPSEPDRSILADNLDSSKQESPTYHAVATSPTKLRTRKLPVRPKTLSQRKSRSKLKNASSQLSSSIEDLDESDYSVAEKTPVTFKSEIGVQTPSHFREFIASTPTSSGKNLAPTYEEDLALQCNCRLQIAEEEDKLFAHTLAVSYVQDGLPLVPHLSFTDEEVNFVRCQDENTDIGHVYRENEQWSKGAQIGLGAFSACYQARDIFTGTLMAVKQVNHVRCSPVEERQVFQVIMEEITLMRRLSHPNIVRLHGVTKEGALYNIFIEWCAGGSVSTLLSHYGPFNEKVIVNYSLQMLRGLAYLHEQQLIHRDVKGANLLVDSTGQRLRISDFGAAARLASKGTGAGEFQGQLLGTIAFMAPEVLRGEQYGRSCDIWSAGCVVTEMASGKPPWEADKHSNHLALIFKIASAPSVPPIPDSLSPALKDLCRRSLQADPRDRPLATELLKHPVFIKW